MSNFLQCSSHDDELAEIFQGRGVDFDFIDPGSLRALVTPVDEALQTLGVSFGNNLYTPVGEVADPAVKIQFQRLQMREFSKKYTLNPPLYQ